MTVFLGLFGGTFDPIHHGHLRTARDAARALHLDALHFVPAADPPHRARPAASEADRLAMTQLAIEGEPAFAVDDREIRRGGRSYTVLTLESLRAERPEGAPLCLLIGADAFLGFETWHRWHEIPTLAHIAVLGRPGAGVSADPQTWPAWARSRACADVTVLSREPAGRVVFVQVEMQDISATRIREAVASGRSIAELVPARVAGYIQSHGLYRVPQPDQPESMH